MFAQLRSQKRTPRYGREVAKMQSFPPPIKGWNTRDPLPGMDIEHAVWLDNMIPGTAGVTMRAGYAEWKTGLPDYPETLMAYAPPSGTNVLFAATPAAIYDVTTQGAVGAASVSSLSNGRWQHVNFATSGGTFLCIVNGADNYRTFNGAAWTDQGAAVTGVTSSTFANICSHQNRLWFIPNNSQDVWYLGVQSITGAATKFALGALLTRGSNLLAMGSWTRDGGAGMDDLAVFVSSAGEVLVYEGIDPGSADTWALIGRFTCPPPIGRRCMVKAGSDLAILTAGGVVLVSDLLSKGESAQRGAAVSDAIRGSYESAYTIAGTSFGWQILEYPKEQLLVVNVPIAERDTAYQFVCNMATGAWCRFTNIDAGAWGVMGDRLFFARHDGTICRYGDETSDAGEEIECLLQTAFSTFKSPMRKVVHAARPVMKAPAGLRPTISALFDYDTEPLTSGAATVYASGAVWDVALWGVADWGESGVTQARWQTVHGDGTAVSLAIRVAITESFTLNATDLLLEYGAAM